MEDAATWAERTFASAVLGDARRTKRLVRVGAMMASNPEAGIPEQAGDRSAAKAAYRLLEAATTTHEAVTAPHCAATRSLAAQAPGAVLFIHDDTQVDLSSHKAATGFGPIGDGRGTGFLVHTCLAVCETDRRPLGVAWQKPWIRPSLLPEGQVWADCVAALGPCPSGQTWISLADRGADVLGHVLACRAGGLHCIVRAYHDRKAADGGKTLERLRAKPARAAHTAVVSGTETSFVLSWSQETLRAGTGEPLEVWYVRVWNDDTEWILLTTLPVHTPEDATRCAERYSLRWLVEEFHKALKSGCALEKRQLRSAPAFLAVCGLLSLVAVRLLQVRTEARLAPNAPAAVDPVLITILARRRGKPREHFASNRDFHRGVAMLGGFLGRKADGEPGWQSLWNGWRELLLLYAGYLIAKEENCG